MKRKITKPSKNKKTVKKSPVKKQVAKKIVKKTANKVVTNNKPLVSIVLPSYNGEKYIKEALDSVLEQTYKNWELILVDDGSKDNTAKIMKKYSDKYKNIIFHPNKQNSRLPTTLNNGFQIAKGKYYTWISDDNIFEKDAIEIMVNEMMKNPDVDVIYTDYETIDDKGNFIAKEKMGSNVNKIMFHYLIGPCFMYKPECHHSIGGYDPSYRMCEDYDYFLRMYYHGFKFKHLDKFLFKYRKHGAAMSANVEGLILNTEKAIITNAIKNKDKISRRNLSKIYIDRFCKNVFQLKWGFLVKGFYYHPIYAFFRIFAIIKRFFCCKFKKSM